MIYLASPYSHPDPAVRQARFVAVCGRAAELMREGLNVFSPIAHSHPLVEHGAPTDWEAWKRVDMEMIGFCSHLYVLRIDGWQESVGVQAEIAEAERLGKKVLFV